jgi:WD40-like Beta Propeller Repeat
MRRDRELERRLAELEMPGEAEAEERSWEVIREAYAERTPVRPTYRARRFALAAAVGAVLLAIGLSPAGAQVGDWVHDVVGEEDAKPELKTLPAAGEILVEGGDGVWIVEDDGSRRRLGDYDEATWSPNGLYVAVTEGDRLLAVDPEGEVRWEIDAPATVHDPRWAGTEFDTRIAYRSGGDLWVVAGDGSGQRLIARDVAPMAPVWRSLGDTKLGTPGPHVVTFLDGDGRPQAVDADTGRKTAMTRSERASFATAGVGPDASARVPSPTQPRSALVRHPDGGSQLLLVGEGERPRPLLSGPGELTEPTWSPDGRWILVGWVEADQWVYVNADQPRRVVGFDNIAEQFDPEGDYSRSYLKRLGAADVDFPRVAGWVLPPP